MNEPEIDPILEELFPSDCDPFEEFREKYARIDKPHHPFKKTNEKKLVRQNAERKLDIENKK